MVLQTLEFSECLTDSPFFREKVHAHEKEIEKTSKSIKGLVKECSDLLTAANQLSKAQRNFSKLLSEFEFECIGSEKTDDEILIEKSLNEFGKIISTIEDARDNLLERVRTAVLNPMHGFRKDKIGEVKKWRQTFEKQTSKFYQSQERYLGLKPAKASETQLAEADESLEQERKGFCKESMNYVVMLQEVQERKKFEFVELLLQFMFSWLTFYHEGYELCNDFQPYLKDLSSKLQKCRANFESTKDEAEILKNKILESGAAPPSSRSHAREGYLFMLEKKALTSSWTKHYCQYQKDTKQLVIIPFNQLANNKISSSTPKETFTLTSCTRRAAESIEKRFCFDLTIQEKQQPITFQACSERERRLWLDVMDGKEPIYAEPPRANQLESLLDDIGFNFIKKCIQAIETNGLEDEGLYRVVGVNSKVTKLTTILLDRKKADKVDLLNELDNWEMKTITSALKNYFRALPEPLMTFKLHQKFIRAAKQESKTLRINDIHELVHQLPESNFEMLDLLIAHLRKVSESSQKNLMNVSNIGVCFGPTLMRPEEETMATIMDIKFCNLIVEILIENYEKVFKTRPEFADISNTRVLDSKPPVPIPIPQQPLKNLPYNSQCTTVNSQLYSTTHALSTSLGGALPSSKEPLPSPFSQLVRPGKNLRAPSNGRLASTHGTSLSVSTPTTYSRSPQMNNLDSSNSHISQHQQRTGIKSSSVPNSQLNPDHHSSASSSSESLNFRCSNSSVSTTQSSYSAPGWPPKSQNKWSGNSTSSTVTSSSKLEQTSTKTVRTLYSCTAENDSELSFEPNELITNVRQSKEPGWLEGMLKGRSGLIPANYVEFLN